VKGQFDAETLKIYDEAAKLALTSGNLPKYLELAFRAAAVQQRREELAEAAERALELGRTLASRLSAEDPLQAKAALIHLQGIRWWREAQALKGTGDAGDGLIAPYTEHLHLWPSQPSTSAASIELAAIYEKADNVDAAFDLYRHVPRDDKLFPAALAGAIRIWPEVIKSWETKNIPKNDRARYPTDQLATYFRGAIAPSNDPLPLEFTDTDRTAALGGARLLLQHTTDGYAAAEELLRGALLGSPNEAPQWKQSVQALLVVALAGQPRKRGEAEQIVAQLGQDSPAQLLEMLGGLTELSRASSREVQTELAALQLRALELLRPQRAKLGAGQQVALAQIEAEALVAAGRRDEALAAYEKLAKEQPNSAAVQQGYAELLSASQDRTTMEKALAQWRVVAQGSRPQTERWFKSKYEVANLSYRLGEAQQAAQLIKYLQVTPPGLDATPLKRQFLELLEKCEK
jgi:tetratricopeptide (TPR) repeat protein